jgi:membrane associated rhomboid family serine protease
MGFYDRDYQRGWDEQREPGLHVNLPSTLTTKLIIVTCGIYLVQLATEPWLSDVGALQGDWYRRPWLAYQLLSYGFLHSTQDLWHIALNMFALWLFGREVEARYGKREFLAFYMVAIVVAGLVWTLAEIPSHGVGAMMGASGGIAAVVILFALNFPYRTILFMFIIPMPMWVFALIIVLMDAMGAVNRAGSNVAYTAHLGGAVFAFLYYKWGLRFERWLPGLNWTPSLRRRPKLRVLDPDSVELDSTETRVDEILKKIQEHGQDSLTRGERRILEQASKEYQKRRQ